MGPRDWFGVGVRLFGIWCFLDAINEFRNLILIRLELWKPTTAPGIYVIHAAMSAIIGVYLLSFAEHLVTLIYGKAKRRLDALPEETEQETRDNT